MTGGSAGQYVDGRFELLDRLGSGGMGTVWRARDHALEREVALKEVRPPSPSATTDEDTASRKLRERVLREARALARINHPGVVTIHHIIDQAPHPWLVMELVPGSNLHDRLDRGPLPPQEAARIGREVLGALRAAHAAGIHHRDVKPANVLLRADGSAVLTDFGIAALQGSSSLTATGELIGSPEYIAPERIRSAADDPAADLWSLGMLLYIAVEGHSPLRRDSALATLAAVLDEPLPPPVQAGPLAPVLNALLVRDPAARPDAARLDEMLAQVLHGSTPPPYPPGGHAPPNALPTQTAHAPVPPARPTPPPGAPPHRPTTAVPHHLAQPPRERNRKALAVGAGVGALLLLGGLVGGALLARSGGESNGAQPGESTGTADDKPDQHSSEPADDDASGPKTPTESPATNEESPAPDPTSEPPARPVGWVAQLFSEPVSSGTAARDKRLAAVRKSVPQAQVLRSDDYASLNPGYWVIYAPGPFTSGNAAVGFCATKGRTSSNTCVGRYLSDSAADRVYVCHPQGGGSGRCTRS